MTAYTPQSRRILRLATEWLQGMTVSIAEQTGVGHADVADVLRRNGLLPPPAQEGYRAHLERQHRGRSYKSPHEARIIELTKQGLSGAQIAERLPLGRGSIYRIQRRNGLPTDGSYDAEATTHR